MNYLSFGGGVNSTALMLWLVDRKVEFEAVYADHGTDWPETRQYVQMLKQKGYPITIIETRYHGLPLDDFCLERECIPSRIQRWCTGAYKVIPLAKYMPTPCTVYLGISADEERRATRLRAGQRRNETLEFPLVDEDIDRQGCIDIIEAHRLPLPIKSCCYICPFQNKEKWLALRTQHPELWAKAKRIEEGSNRRMATLGRKPIWLSNSKRPLDQVGLTRRTTTEAEAEAEYSAAPCICGL